MYIWRIPLPQKLQIFSKPLLIILIEFDISTFACNNVKKILIILSELGISNGKQKKAWKFYLKKVDIDFVTHHINIYK